MAAASVPAYEAGIPSELRAKIAAPFKGDLDAMIQRRLIRVAATFNRTAYFLDGGVERGLSYEYVKLYEEKLNESLGKGHPRVFIVISPVPRDKLLPDLNEGKVDMVAAQLTITPERAALVDFTMPTRTGINEIAVTGPGTNPIRSLDELSGKTIFVRKSSSYFHSLEELNKQLASRGRPPVKIEAAPENLEDDDLLEMVNAGLVPGTVVDNYLAAAQGYQESRLDQTARSRAGAMGVMQLLPATGKEQGVGDISQIDPNIHAGVKYMSFMQHRYFANEPMDNVNKALFTFAAYNAGPGRVRKLRQEAAARDLNPNLWFGNVEQIAAEQIGAETVTYVSNIFKYYVAYKLIMEEAARREQTKRSIAMASKRGH